MDDPGPERLSFLGRRLPAAFELWSVTLEPGQTLRYDEADWRDAIVAVDGGALELECLSGRRQRFARGDLLWLDGVPLRALRNPGRAPALLTVVARRQRPMSLGPAGRPNSEWRSRNEETTCDD
jgi:hypothetical protein